MPKEMIRTECCKIYINVLTRTPTPTQPTLGLISPFPRRWPRKFINQCEHAITRESTIADTETQIDDSFTNIPLERRDVLTLNLHLRAVISVQQAPKSHHDTTLLLRIINHFASRGFLDNTSSIDNHFSNSNGNLISVITPSAHRASSLFQLPQS